MKNTLRSLAAPLGISVAAAFFCVGPARAQRYVKWLVGPEGGYNFVIYRSDAFPILNELPHSFLAQNGTGNGYFWGLSGEYPLDTNMRHFLILEAGFDSKPGTFSNLSPSSGSTIVVEHNGQNSDTMVIVTSVSLWTKLSYYYVNLGYKYNLRADSIPNGLGIQLCLSIGFKNEADFWKSVSVTPQTSTNASSITTAQSLRLALRPELTYDLPLTHAWVLTPFAGYEFPLTKVDPSENWWASALYGGLALRYAIW